MFFGLNFIAFNFQLIINTSFCECVLNFLWKKWLDCCLQKHQEKNCHTVNFWRTFGQKTHSSVRWNSEFLPNIISPKIETFQLCPFRRSVICFPEKQFFWNLRTRENSRRTWKKLQTKENFELQTLCLLFHVQKPSISFNLLARRKDPKNKNSLVDHPVFEKMLQKMLQMVYVFTLFENCEWKNFETQKQKPKVNVELNFWGRKMWKTMLPV